MHRLFFLLLLLPGSVLAQASLTAIGTPYTQNFNTLPNTTDGSTMSTWTQNVTLPGWYIDEGFGGTCSGTACDDLPTIEASYTTMNNGGNAYVYASGADRSIGSRAAGSTGTVYFGVRFVNNTGTTISSLYVDYYGEQWTIAENGSNINTFTLEHQTGATVTSLTGGTWTASGLNFTQVYGSGQSSSLGGTVCGGSSSQCLALDGNLAANRTHIQGCISVNIPPGQEIMLRWSDVNDGANDHHLQIDDVTVYPFDVSCAVVLPVEMTVFTAERSGNVSLLQWETSSETNNDYFQVERMNENGVFNVIGTVNGNGTTSLPSAYSFVDEYPYDGVNYYRLRQVDFNGDFMLSPVRTVEFGTEEIFEASAWYAGELHFSQSGYTGETHISVFSEDGRMVSSSFHSEQQGTLPTPFSSGVYFIRFENAEGTVTVKLVILL